MTCPWCTSPGFTARELREHKRVCPKRTGYHVRHAFLDDPDTVKLIRLLNGKGFTPRTIARLVGCSTTPVRRILSLR